MRGKRLKLIYFSTSESQLKELSLGWKNISLLFTGFLTVCLFFLFIGLLLFTDLFYDAEVNTLKKTNGQLKEMLAEMESKVKEIQKQINDIEKNDRDLRVFVDLEDPGEDARKLGRGGLSDASFASMYSSSADEALKKAKRITLLLKNVDHRIGKALDSREEIIDKYNENDEKWKHIPSIKPVEGGRNSAYFGWRRHPLTGKDQFHEGLDIAASRGTPVIAPADGVVVEALVNYRPNESYGKQIVIDHGYGIKTRYAHLRHVRVHVGQKVQRFALIGTVGDTGRSTGPHLHYEVIVDEKPANPLFYILD